VRLLLLASERNAADTVQRREAGVAFQLIKPPRACDVYECVATPQRAGAGARQAAEAARPQAVAPSPPPPAPPPSSGHGKRRKVLLAEDNPVNVQVASAMLRGLGLDVRCAGNGAEALDAVRAGGFDAVLMDCQMPVMDGMAATAEIRRHEQQQGRTRLPVVAITANALPGDRETCLAAGMDDYLSKPFTQQGLGETLARWIRLPRVPARQADAQVDVQPARARAGADPLNPRALDNIRALDNGNGKTPSLLRRVMQSYLDSTPQQLAALRAALEAKQPDELRRIAHSLKSGSANVGAEALARLCKEMEQLGKAHTTEGAPALLAGMEREFEAVRRALCTVLEKEP
jgi:CheY-like chemotaxis protein